MKMLFSLLFSLLVSNTYALDLTTYSVFALNGIEAGFSDIQGAIGTTGNIELNDFQINATQAPTNFTLTASGSVWLNRVEVTKRDSQGRNIGKMYASNFSIANSGRVGARHIYHHDYNELVTQFNTLNSQLWSLSPNLNTKFINGTIEFDANMLNQEVAVFEINAADLARFGHIKFSGRFEQTIVIKVLGTIAQLQNKGMELNGLQLGKVLFYFPEASEVKVSHSGYVGDLQKPVSQRTGIPASFFVPYGTFTFTSGLMTGAVFADKYVSPHNGQINHTLFTGNFDCLNRTKGIQSCSKVQGHGKNHQGQSQSK